MFSNLVVGIVMGIGVGGWVYMKLQKYTGNNSQSSAVGAGLVALIVCLIATTLMGLLSR